MPDRWRALHVILALVLFLALAASCSYGGGQPTTYYTTAPKAAVVATAVPPAPAAVAPQFQLALISANCDIYRGQSGGLYIRSCQGFVKNLTASSIGGIHVSVDFFDSTGVPQQTMIGLLGFSPLLAGQTTSWSVSNNSTPGLDRIAVHFIKTNTRQLILLRDDR